MSRKYTFVEFIAALDSDDFDNIDDSWLEWAKGFVGHFNSPNSSVHYGDCTRAPISCYLCTMEALLRDYREYYFNEEEWRLKN